MTPKAFFVEKINRINWIIMDVSQIIQKVQCDILKGQITKKILQGASPSENQKIF